MTTTPAEATAALWHRAGLPREALGWLDLAGAEPALPSSFRVGTAAQASIAAMALAAAALHRQRGGPAQRVAVEMRHAAAEFRSERLLRIDGHEAPELWDAIAGLYPTADGWVRLHTNFPHHRDGVLRLLGVGNDRAEVARALLGRQALAFEDAAAAAGLCVAALRSFAEWDAHPQGRAIPDWPLRIERIGDAPPQPLPAGTRPLEGIRVLEMTRIIAGPVAGRALAAHGADVLLVTGPHLPAVAPLVIDTGRGKRSAQLDLRVPADLARLEDLLRQADVFLQSYRPGALAARGLGAQRLAALRPGIVCASLSAYGTEGPWRDRRGFDSLVQTASGFNAAEAEAAGERKPRPLPAQALDHASGYLLAFGILAALHRRAVEGGSWQVSVSLAGTGRWLRGLGRLEGGFAAPDPTRAELADLLEESDSGFGRLSAVRHAARMEATPAFFARPSVPLGTDAPEW
ncbi:CoA transferase [Roseomonas marmotae]|uniref:CoA transferase n=1 Tax=Roseomonas marmotae TaxID=2768161 RepID=A0ABS3KCA0_9PROT|nr:CoA transferase [Roseomonas marmotae]MBO1075091.1 CoA transferase [Roseomonas marmotae]QTI79792.1 CoA transferase [Roseomonas marmotae]